MYYWVTEYGDNIGTIKNCFLSYDKAVSFVHQIIKHPDRTYQQISGTQWLCLEKNEAIEIEIN